MDPPQYFVKLMACAEAIEGGDLNLADSIFEEIRSLIAAESNSAIRKVVNYFSQALARRVYGLHPPNFTSPTILDIFDLRLFQFPLSFIALQTTRHVILNCLNGIKPLHIISFSILDAYRLLTVFQMWGLFKHSASWRLTVVGSTLMSEDTIRESARIISSIKNLECEQLVADTAVEIVDCVNKLRRTSADETIVVSWMFQLHKLLALPGAIEQVLFILKDLKPEMIVIAEQEVDNNSGNFMNRLAQSLQFHSTVFDMLEYHSQYNKAWDTFFRRQIDNVVACEGIDRVVRHETLVQWEHRLRLSGFRQVPVWNDELKYPHKQRWPKCRVEENNGCPLLCWDNKPLFVASIWKPDTTRQFNEGDDINHPITIQDTSQPLFHVLEQSDPFSSSEPDDDNETNNRSITLESKTWSIEEIRKYLKTPFEDKEKRIIAWWTSSNTTGEVDGRNKKLNVSDTSLKILLNIPPLDMSDKEKERYYIDDLVIDAFFELLTMRSKKFPSLYVRSCSISTLIGYFLLQINRHRELPQSTIDEMKGSSKLFMPVCLQNHWILVCIDMEQQRLFWLNPLICYQLHAYQIDKGIIWRWVIEYLLPKLGYINLQEWQFQEVTNIPIQQSSVDCGIFVMKYADCLAHGNHFPFTQDDMPHFRRRIFLDIYKGKIVLPKQI